MNEQEATDELERLVGTPGKCFRLMNIYRNAQSTVSGDRYSLRRKSRTLESVFTEAAKREGYSQPAITHYLNNIR